MKGGRGFTITFAAAILLGLAGCGTQASDPPALSVPVSANSTTTTTAFRRAHLAPGIQLGYRNTLYKLVRPVPPADVGHKLGTVVYHGSLGQDFTLYTEKGVPASRAVIFQTTTGQDFEGLVVKGQP